MTLSTAVLPPIFRSEVTEALRAADGQGNRHFIIGGPVKSSATKLAYPYFHFGPQSVSFCVGVLVSTGPKEAPFKSAPSSRMVKVSSKASCNFLEFMALLLMLVLRSLRDSPERVDAICSQLDGVCPPSLSLSRAQSFLRRCTTARVSSTTFHALHVV